MSLVGIHVSNLNDINDLVNKGINLFQIFVSVSTDYNSEKYTKILKMIKNKKIYIVVHASYTINLARRWTDFDWWIQQLINEIQISGKIGAFGIVVHTGKQLDLSISEALNNMYTSFLYIHNKTLDYMDVKIIIETPSGQGTETLTNIVDLCKFMNKFYKHPDKNINERFGICIDTCHIFAAGNDIRSEKGTDIFFGIINDAIGIDKIKLCHVNDSKGELGLNLDRHQNIGKGEIGKKAIINIVKFMKKLDVPLILETPWKFIYADYILVINS